ncbi:MAG: ketoacyl-ACP synthase III [Bacteroidales bacterium]|nr:ketoacyl-ACP synthase III [Bacteroidales bacterium]
MTTATHNNIIITGTGSYIPIGVVTNEDFAGTVFYDMDGTAFAGSHEEISEKFLAITGIIERRYASDNQVASDIGAIAAQRAIEDAAINPEEIDQIIVAHDFGDVRKHTIQTDTVPSLASRIKQKLGIENPFCVAYDLLFGCPGWLQGLIQAEAFVRAGQTKNCLVVGTETLSRVIDMYDRDSMIYADGAGACVLQLKEGDHQEGILSSVSATYAKKEAYYLYLGQSNNATADPKIRYIKMLGRKIYEFALTHVPAAMKAALDKIGADVHDLKKIFIHQANEKMDDEIIKRFYRLYKIREVPEGITPMSIHKLGNSSVATIPTLFDQVRKGEGDEKGHCLRPGDLIMFASVGAGMNINAMAYRY